MDLYFMDIARAVAKKSKDPNTNVGAVIVDENNRIVSTGYNGMIKGCSEKHLWTNKYPFVIHAEMNAALFARRYLGGCQVYITHAPCINCMKHLFQMGVRVIFYEQLKTKSPLSESEKGDIRLMLQSLNCLVKNINHKTYQEELDEICR